MGGIGGSTFQQHLVQDQFLEIGYYPQGSFIWVDRCSKWRHFFAKLWLCSHLLSQEKSPEYEAEIEKWEARQRHKQELWEWDQQFLREVNSTSDETFSIIEEK